jgi:hypothetical protein
MSFIARLVAFSTVALMFYLFSDIWGVLAHVFECTAEALR